MISTQVVLYAAAMIVLIIGAFVDSPRFNVTRCIALGLGLIVAAQLVTVLR